ncbi:hypothetical protein [Niabella hibiscisoli]|uniref:hypothetical protein n=1 Tax=Niabella hibiscisoli TaxID=1825928 RepID=UPI001F0CF0C9|nr:hypothetical protein [Niabella hibiscisoli]MCH5719258.1 hypothetical protein [Niabella hibiscisoli]
MKPQLIDVSLAGTKTIRIKRVEQAFLDTPFHFHHLCELVWIEKVLGNESLEIVSTILRVATWY